MATFAGQLAAGICFEGAAMTAIIVPFRSPAKPSPPDETPNQPQAGMFAPGQETGGLVRLESHRASMQVEVIREAAVKMGWHVPNDPRRAAETIAGKLVQIALVMERTAKATRPGAARRVPRGRSRRAKHGI
jgi:hypothetical protein